MIDDAPFAGDEIRDAEIEAIFLDSEAIVSLRRAMIKFATSRLYDFHLAEDAVQEALIGAFQGRRAFGGKASIKTWALGILKNKIGDILRSRRGRAESSYDQCNGAGDDLDDGAAHPSGDAGMFGPDGGAHGDPESALLKERFWTALESALEALPGVQAELFVMHELGQTDMAQMRERMGISEGNFYVQIHRAKKKLRLQMRHWGPDDFHPH